MQRSWICLISQGNQTAEAKIVMYVNILINEFIDRKERVLLAVVIAAFDYSAVVIAAFHYSAVVIAAFDYSAVVIAAFDYSAVVIAAFATLLLLMFDFVVVVVVAVVIAVVVVVDFPIISLSM